MKAWILSPGVSVSSWTGKEPDYLSCAAGVSEVWVDWFEMDNISVIHSCWALLQRCFENLCTSEFWLFPLVPPKPTHLTLTHILSTHLERTREHLASLCVMSSYPSRLTWSWKNRPKFPCRAIARKTSHVTHHLPGRGIRQLAELILLSVSSSLRCISHLQ